MAPTAAEILRFIAAREPLSLTAARFNLPRAAVARLLSDAADGSHGAGLAPASPAPTPAAESEAKPRSPSRAAPPEPMAPAEPRLAAPAGALTRARVFSDGASRGNPGPSGAGAVIVDAQSGAIVERLKRFLGRQTNNVAEYEGVILGLRRALELGIREVEVVADSQLMIRQLGGRYKVKNAGLQPLYKTALDLLKQFDQVRLVHVPREMNTEADTMSNRAIDEA